MGPDECPKPKQEYPVVYGEAPKKDPLNVFRVHGETHRATLIAKRQSAVGVIWCWDIAFATVRDVDSEGNECLRLKVRFNISRHPSRL
jgi:hypothetical protein